MRKILDYLGLEDKISVTWHTKNLGVSILSSLVMLVATFTPIVGFHQVEFIDYTNDFAGSRGSILVLEVAGIGLNLLGAKKVAWVLYGLSVTEIIIMFAGMWGWLSVINSELEKEASYGYNPYLGFGWGWIAILVGPAIMGRVYLKDYLANRA